MTFNQWLQSLTNEQRYDFDCDGRGYKKDANIMMRLAWDAATAEERERHAGWFALVMNAAAALEDAANCLRDPDAKRAAEGAAKHYRAAANVMWDECAPNMSRKRI